MLPFHEYGGGGEPPSIENSFNPIALESSTSSSDSDSGEKLAASVPPVVAVGVQKVFPSFTKYVHDPNVWKKNVELEENNRVPLPEKKKTRPPRKPRRDPELHEPSSSGWGMVNRMTMAALLFVLLAAWWMKAGAEEVSFIKDEERPGNENPEAGEQKNLQLQLPKKDLLEYVFSLLQCGEMKDFSGHEPVDPKENAMNSTGPDTDNIKQVKAINDQAERLFDKLKTDLNGLKSELPSERCKRSRKPRDEARSSSTKSGPNRIRLVGGGSIDQHPLITVEIYEIYDLLSQARRNPLTFSTPNESTQLEQTGCMPMPGIPSDLVGAATCQELQHQSTPHGQQGDIYPVDMGALQQKRQRVDAGPLVWFTHQELHYASDPRVKPSGSNPVGQGVWQEHEQALTTLGQTGCIPMRAQLGILLDQLGAPDLQELQHHFAPHGQQGDIYPVIRGAPQQQRRCVFAGPLGWLMLQELDHASDPLVGPSGNNPVGRGVWQEHEKVLTMLGPTGCIPMPAQLEILSDLHGAPTLQELQHLSAHHGQQGGIYPVDCGAPPQQRQRVFADPLGCLMVQEPNHTSDSRLSPSGSNPVGRGVWQDFPQGRRHLNQRGPGQGLVGPGGSGAGAGNAYGGGAPQGGQEQQ